MDYAITRNLRAARNARMPHQTKKARRSEPKSLILLVGGTGIEPVTLAV